MAILSVRVSKRFSFAIGTAIAVLACVALGNWQLERLKWKKDLIAGIVAGLSAIPVELNASVPEWRRVTISGVWLNEAPFFVGPVSKRGRAGWYVVSPIRSSDGSILFVNRGFSPSKARYLKSAGKVRNLLGIIRKPKRAGVFVPDNNPIAEDWFRVVPVDFARARDLRGVLPFWVDALEVPAGSTLIANVTPQLPPNNHLEYAVTWYAFAFTAAVIALLFWMKNK